jgi:hypothetical protein
MANALGPYFVRINYHSAWAPHTMTIPTRTWSPDGGAGTFEDWSAGAIAADTMVLGLVTLMLPFFPGDVHFDNWTVFKQLAPSDDPQPMVSETFSGAVGSNVGGSWAPAVEVIIVARTSLFGLAKLDLLDACSEDNFTPILTASGALADLITEWFSSANAWAGRDNGQPNNFLKYTRNLNQKLRKEYRFT